MTTKYRTIAVPIKFDGCLCGHSLRENQRCSGYCFVSETGEASCRYFREDDTLMEETTGGDDDYPYAHMRWPECIEEYGME